MKDGKDKVKRTALHVSEMRVFVGFGERCRKSLAPVVRNGRRFAPSPTCVRRVLKDERPSRKMLVNIFRNCPELLRHPQTSKAVKRLHLLWNAMGTLPERYGRGMPPARAADCMPTEGGR